MPWLLQDDDGAVDDTMFHLNLQTPSAGIDAQFVERQGRRSTSRLPYGDQVNQDPVDERARVVRSLLRRVTRQVEQPFRVVTSSSVRSNEVALTGRCCPTPVRPARRGSCKRRPSRVSRPRPEPPAPAAVVGGDHGRRRHPLAHGPGCRAGDRSRRLLRLGLVAAARPSRVDAWPSH